MTRFLLQKDYFLDGTLTMPPPVAIDFWQQVQASSFAVVFYVELLRLTLDMIKKGYSQNLFKLKKSINTLFILAVEAKLEDLGTNVGFRAQQAQLKKLTLDSQGEDMSNLDSKGYLVRLLNIPLELNYGTISNTSLMRVVCNLPLDSEVSKSDYYKHLDIYTQCTRETDVKDTGEILFAVNVVIENYDESEFDDFFKVGSRDSELYGDVRYCASVHHSQPEKTCRGVLQLLVSSGPAL